MAHGFPSRKSRANNTDIQELDMKIFNHIAARALLTMSLLIPGLAFAHAELTKSTPGNGDVLNASTDTLDLHFSENVRLLSLAVGKADGQEVDISFTPSSDASAHFAIDLPDLAGGAYTVTGAVMGDDSHRVEVTLSFTIDANATPVINQPGATTEHKEGHTH
jgi:methionine-rich copper-binding protein CopC